MFSIPWVIHKTGCLISEVCKMAERKNGKRMIYIYFFSVQQDFSELLKYISIKSCEYLQDSNCTLADGGREISLQ